MKVLVTGGAGFIGSHTVDELLRHGHTVRVLDDLDPRVHPNGRPSYIPSEVEFIEGSVNDITVFTQALEGVKAVFHLAAYQDYMTDFHRFIHTNTESTALLYEIIVDHAPHVEKVILASSQSVSGEGKYACDEHGMVLPEPRPLQQLMRGEWEVTCPECEKPIRNLPIDEGVCRPHTAYGISKFALELLGLNLGRRYGIATACMRYTYVQGPRNSFYNAYSGVLRRFALQVMHGISPLVYEDGGQLRDFVNVADVARANLIALEDPRSALGVFNVGGGRAYTVLEFARMVIGAFDADLEVVIPGEFRVGDTRHTISDLSRMHSLGWEPRIPVEQSIAEYRDWITDQRGTRAYLAEAERVMRIGNVIRKVSGVP